MEPASVGARDELGPFPFAPSARRKEESGPFAPERGCRGKSRGRLGEGKGRKGWKGQKGRKGHEVEGRLKLLFFGGVLWLTGQKRLC